MKYKENISEASFYSGITSFSGINRRVSTYLGEFADMENLGNEEYPCIQSVKSARNTGFELPENIEAVKLIFPKRLGDGINGFSGVAYNTSENRYEIYINGEVKRSDIYSFTDAVDYNGSIIVLPEYKGFNYMATGNVKQSETYINPSTISGQMSFYNNYTDSTAASLAPKLTIKGYSKADFEKMFCVGDEIMLSDFGNEFENNNTIFPESSTDYTDIISPVRITIKSIASGGSNLSPVTELVVEIRNSKDEIIGWHKGKGSSQSSEGATDYTQGTLTKYMPRGSYCAVAHNRLWVCSRNGEEINASAPGKPFNFYNMSGLASDSWSASTGTPGNFTGIAAWQNRVVVFKSNMLHVVYGTMSSSFGIEKTYASGCVCPDSIAEAGGALVWLSYDGFYSYMGAMPRRISDKLNTKYISCTAFSDGRKYYARCTKDDNTTEFVVYDTEMGVWTKISDIDAVSGDCIGGKAYVCDKSQLYCLYDGEYGDFYGETSDMTFNIIEDKWIMYITVRCIIDNGFLNIYTCADGGTQVSHKGISKTGKHKLPIRCNPGDTFRLRLEGRGRVCVKEIKTDIIMKEEYESWRFK